VARVGHQRWVICALLFFAATINYIDRQVIGLLKPTLQASSAGPRSTTPTSSLRFSSPTPWDLLMAGRLMDRLGARIGFAVAIVIWSLAAMAHAEAEVFGGIAAGILAIAGLTYSVSVAGFIFARFALGLGEAGNFPAAIKVVAEWFPKRERALATGLFNSGTNVGALITPLVVPFITITWGWYWAFVATGALGFLWLAWWWIAYRSPEHHPGVSASELAYIRSDPPEPTVRVPWRTLLKHRQTWAFALGKFLTDPVWWLYLFWIPDFLNRNYGLDLTTVGPPLVAIYLVADVGSVGGGWLSSFLMKRGTSLNAARKIAMLTCAVAVLPIVFAAGARDLWVAGRDHQPRRSGASRVVGESVHTHVRHVPATGGRIRGRPRWHVWRRRRDADCEADRIHPAGDWQLRTCVSHRGVGVSHRACRDSPAGAQTGTCPSRLDLPDPIHAS
jgi:ACS family hexuronate transporter-like MFS transporter